MCPYFTIILPHFNSGYNQLCRSINSVVSQANRALRIELIMVDDGSGLRFVEEAAKVVKNVSGRKGFALRLMKHTTNRGLATARNTGMAAADGKHVIFLDADDWLLPECLSKLKVHLDANPADLTYTLTAPARDGSAQSLDQPANTDVAIAAAYKKLDIATATPEQVPQLALAMSSWSQVYSRDFLVRSGLKFDPALRRWEDRPFVVASHAAAHSVALYPHLFHAYFVGAEGKDPVSITRRKYELADLRMMYRHIRAVARLLASTQELAGSSYAAQHFWLSVQRYLSVMGGAALPLFFTNAKVRRLSLGTARWLWEIRPAALPNSSAPMLPLPDTAPGRVSGLLRGTLLYLFKNANNLVGATLLFTIFAMVALFRRVRTLFR